MITIDGVLRSVETRINAHLEYVAVHLVDAGERCPPFQVTRVFGPDPAHALDAERYARGLRPGMTVRASGTMLQHVDDHGVVRFALRGLVPDSLVIGAHV